MRSSVIIGVWIVLSLAACGSTNPAKASTTPTTFATGASTPLSAQPGATTSRYTTSADCPTIFTGHLTKPTWGSPPAFTIDASKSYTATVTTDVGSFVITLDVTRAPKTVNNFVFLAARHFYDCVIFHRVIPGFMDQTGDPTGTGSGGPGYEFADELPPAATPQYPIGSVAMANSGPNTNGSQFFIVTGAQGESLAPNYSLFGQVTTGIQVVQQINADGNSNPTANGEPPAKLHRIISIIIAAS